MTRETAKRKIEMLDSYLQRVADYGESDHEAMKMAIKALEQEPCEDAISRQAVLDCFTATKLKKFDFVLYAREEINKLPSVNPQPKTGRWIIIDDCEQFIAKCSECGRIEDSRMISKYPYCRCGAKMEKEEKP